MHISYHCEHFDNERKRNGKARQIVIVNSLSHEYLDIISNISTMAYDDVLTNCIDRRYLIVNDKSKHLKIRTFFK